MTVEHDDFDWAEPAARVPFTRVPTWVHDREDLTLYEKAAYAAVARFVSRKEGSTARPGVPALAAAAGCGETRMRDGLKGLVDKGILSIQRRGLGLTNRYRLRFTDPGFGPSRGEDQDPHACDVVEPHASEAPDPHGVTRNQTRVNQDDEDARAASVEPSVWEQVAKKLSTVPEWDHALIAGAELACFSVVQAEPNAPWVSIAARVAASRLDVSSGSIRTNSPRMALEFGLTDWRSGRMGDRQSSGTSGLAPWGEALPKLRERVGQNRRALDLLAGLAHPDHGDLPLATLVATVAIDDWTAFESAMFDGQDTFEGRQAVSRLRKAWQALTPDRPTVDRVLDQLDQQVSDHCVRAGVTRDQLGIATPPFLEGRS